MTFEKGLSTTLGIIDAAADVIGYDGSNKTFNKAVGIGRKLTNVGGAITNVSAQTSILSRAFIDEAIIDEPVIANVMRSCHDWYAAQIIASLSLSSMVDSARTVQDVLSVVQTGHNRRETGTLGNLANRRMVQESFLEAYLGVPATESVTADYDYGPEDPKVGAYTRWRDAVKDAQADRKAEQDAITSKTVESSVSVRSISPSDHRIGPMGELYEVKLTNPNGNGQSVTVPVFVQMQPSLIPAEIAPRFIDMNVSPSAWQRWTMMRAGELSFVKDWILHRDAIRRAKAIIKDPKKATAFNDFLKTVHKKDSYALGDATDRNSARMSSNLANSVVVFSEDAVARAKIDSGIDLHKQSDRDRYFRDTYTMIIVVVDPLHQRVIIYFNGIDGEIDAPYSDFKSKDSKFDPNDFMQALQAFSTNSIGRLR